MQLLRMGRRLHGAVVAARAGLSGRGAVVAKVLPVCSVLSVRPDGGHQVPSRRRGGGGD
jgi:hypothetical protein